MFINTLKPIVSIALYSPWVLVTTC